MSANDNRTPGTLVHDDRNLSAAFVVALAQHPEAQRELRQHIVSEDVGEQAP